MQMPKREDEGVMRQFIHELRHRRFEREKRADLRQMRVQQRGKRIVIARLCCADEIGFISGIVRWDGHF